MDVAELIDMKKVLVVDDDASIRKLVAASLRKQDVNVFQAITGAEAVALSKQEKPDLIVMDIIFPGQNKSGITVAEQIKQNPENTNCKILLISGVVSVNNEDMALAGADAFLSKPFNPIELREKITSLLGE